MIFRSPAWLFAIPVLILAGAWLARGTRLARPVLALQLLITLLVVLALADPVRPGSDAAAPLLVLVDQSAGLPQTARAAAWRTAMTVVEQQPKASAVVAAFAEDVAIAHDEQPPSVAKEGTDLAGALRFAQGLQPGRILLFSDGAATTPGAADAAQALQAQGIAVDVLPLADAAPMDARVADVVLPAGLRAGQSFTGEVIIESTADTSGQLVVSFNGQVVDEQTVQIEAGRTSVPLPGRALEAGVQRLRAELRLDDGYAENNALEATMLVGPSPRVLVVEQQPDGATYLRDLLELEGIQSEAVRPPDLSSQLSALERFDAIILQDIAASTLTLDQQAALREYVRSIGHGLLTLGGLNSYSLGEYAGTPLAEALPVSMETPPRRERQQVALLLIVDRSASMYGPDPATSKLELAKGGALSAIQALSPEDRVGVLAFDTQTDWTVPFTQIGQGLTQSEILDRIAAIDWGGGTHIYRALGVGLAELARQEVGVRHAVILTDGRSISDKNAYDQLLTAAREHNITLSTIAIGRDADTDLLERLAERGGGRYHFTTDPQELPQLTLLETEIARENPVSEGLFQPQPAAVHPVTRGFVPRLFPLLDGYVALTPRPEADIVLQTPEGDPILAGWHYGLGRALAWTSDSGERWGTEWQDWSDSHRFWSQALGYLFPDPAHGPLSVRVDHSTGTPTIVGEARDEDGAPLDLADVAARVRGPDGNETTVQLAQVAPGRYAAALPIETEGAYSASVVLRKGEGQLTASTGWALPYPAEFAARPDAQLLEGIAALSGGRVLESAEEALVGLQQMAQPRTAQPYWPWLVGAALLLWPVEIALRRGWFRWRAAQHTQPF